MLLTLTFLISALGKVHSLEQNTWYQIVRQGNDYLIINGSDANDKLAWGKFKDDTQKDGWGKLSIYTNQFRSTDEAYAAGYLEGSLTQRQIYLVLLSLSEQHKVNYYDQLFDSEKPNSHVIQFIQKQNSYSVWQTQRFPDDKYWQVVGLIQSFLEGLLLGYNQQAPQSQQLTFTDILLIQAMGDYDDIESAVDRSKRVDWFNIDSKQFSKNFLLRTHCSVMIKQTDDKKDVFMGHNTWNDGQVMLRIYKFYTFGQDFVIQLSGYPGMFHSADDYYVLAKQDQQLFVTETTNELFNTDLYDLVQPQSLLCWQRATIANMLAKNGQDWTIIFKRENSGTYNNQYIIVDAKKYSTTAGPLPGFIWIVEQMPGLIINEDVTQVFIRNGNYWPSYNVPYFDKMYDYSDYDKAYQKEGIEYSYTRAPRALIMKRDHKKSQSLEEFKKFIRYNNYLKDPISRNNPTWTIAARGDLFRKADDRSPNFAYDAKVTSYTRIVNEAGQIVSDIQNGPTHDNLPVFKWSDSRFNESHVGHPDEWNFSWVSINISTDL